MSLFCWRRSVGGAGSGIRRALALVTVAAILSAAIIVFFLEPLYQHNQQQQQLRCLGCPVAPMSRVVRKEAEETASPTEGAHVNAEVTGSAEAQDGKEDETAANAAAVAAVVNTAHPTTKVAEGQPLSVKGEEAGSREETNGQTGTGHQDGLQGSVNAGRGEESPGGKGEAPPPLEQLEEATEEVWEEIQGDQKQPLDIGNVREVMFVMVSKKYNHLEAFFLSLARSTWPRETVIILSHDVKSSKTVRLAHWWQARHFPNIIQWAHPFSCSHAQRRGHGFPVYNLAGDEYDDWQGSCVKNHWWWAANRIWASFPQLEVMYYLEEDFLLAKHSYNAARTLAWEAQRNGMFGFMLQCRTNLWTVSGGMLRSAWEDIHSHSDFFCNLDEYNWDLTVKQTILQASSIPSHLGYLCPPNAMAEHTGTVGKGLTQGKRVQGGEAEMVRLIAKIADRFYHQTDDKTWGFRRASRIEGKSIAETALAAGRGDAPADGLVQKKFYGHEKTFGGFKLARHRYHCEVIAEYYGKPGAKVEGPWKKNAGQAWERSIRKKTASVTA